jgi:pyruvate formate-lyase activating enzyme-like uncharacterized protein
MIIPVQAQPLEAIHNPALRAYAAIYTGIYEDFLRQVAQMGLEIDPQDTSALANEKIERLRHRGVQLRNDEKSLVLNQISPACLACQTGASSATLFISLKCHRDCFFCFNPNQEDYEYFTKNQLDALSALDQMAANDGKKMKYLALTGGEPLLYPAETIAFFERARQHFPKAHTRLYTSGDHLDESLLERLRAAGLQEIRLSLRLNDTDKARQHTYDRLRLCTQYIPAVMVEMPVLPGRLEEMKVVLQELDSIGIFGINLLEFCFPMHNSAAFQARGYRIKSPPYRVLYDYWYAGGLPIAGSELDCLDLVEFALQAGLKLGVHYCSLENKHSGQIFQQNSEHRPPETGYFSRKDYFIKTAKVFGEDIPAALAVFNKLKYHRYVENTQHDSLEFHVGKIKALAGLDMQVAVCSSVVEARSDGAYFRELGLGITTPDTFDLAEDV